LLGESEECEHDDMSARVAGLDYWEEFEDALEAANKFLSAQGEAIMSGFTQYRRSHVAELRPYVEGDNCLSPWNISEYDQARGSPKLGDMIARNPKNHEDQWLVAAKYSPTTLSLRSHRRLSLRLVSRNQACIAQYSQLAQAHVRRSRLRYQHRLRAIDCREYADLRLTKRRLNRLWLRRLKVVGEYFAATNH